MTTLVVAAPCQCPPCAAGRKVASLAQLAQHLGVTAKDLRAVIATGEGPPEYHPAHRTHPRYYVPAADAWLAARNDRAGAA